MTTIQNPKSKVRNPELEESLARIRRLMDACDAWLRDATDPERYDLGPRAHEIMVTYETTEEGRPRRRCRALLSALLERVETGSQERVQVVGAERRTSDARELILKAAQELRQTVTAGVELAANLAEARAMQALRASLLAELAQVSPEAAQRIALAVRQSLEAESQGAPRGDAPPANVPPELPAETPSAERQPAGAPGDVQDEARPAVAQSITATGRRRLSAGAVTGRRRPVAPR